MKLLLALMIGSILGNYLGDQQTIIDCVERGQARMLGGGTVRCEVQRAQGQAAARAAHADHDPSRHAAGGWLALRGLPERVPSGRVVDPRGAWELSNPRARDPVLQRHRLRGGTVGLSNGGL